MELRIIKPKESNAPAKITVHKTGKLGFSRGAMEMLRLEECRYAKFGYDESENLCIVMTAEADEETFAVAKAGQYYYINARTLLQELGVDYTAPATTIFDIRRTGEPHIYRLAQRILKK